MLFRFSMFQNKNELNLGQKCMAVDLALDVINSSSGFAVYLMIAPYLETGMWMMGLNLEEKKAIRSMPMFDLFKAGGMNSVSAGFALGKALGNTISDEEYAAIQKVGAGIASFAILTALAAVYFPIAVALDVCATMGELILACTMIFAPTGLFAAQMTDFLDTSESFALN